MFLLPLKFKVEFLNLTEESPKYAPPSQLLTTTFGQAENILPREMIPTS